MPAQQKSEMRTRKQDKARQARADAKARKACVDEVWRRAGDSGGGWAWCEGLPGVGCLKPLQRGAEGRYEGHVDEIVPKSRGGDPNDPNNCRLLGRCCHFSGPSGAHRHTPNWRDGVV